MKVCQYSKSNWLKSLDEEIEAYTEAQKLHFILYLLF